MEKISRRRFLKVAGLSGIATLLAACAKSTSDPKIKELEATLVGLQAQLNQATKTPEPSPTGTATAMPTETSTATVTATATESPLDKWNRQWPNTAEQAAAKFGGNASQWQRNNLEWPDTKTINNPELNVSGYVNREWRPANPENLPFNWPKNPKEAVTYFFPGQSLDTKFIQPAWIDPKTKLTTGWHLSEDHWLIDGSKADVTLMLHAAEVAEGYTVNGTLDPSDDRNWVAFEGFKKNLTIPLPKGQGITVWMPGTDPNAVALRMELFTPGDTPHYQGLSGKQLGPDAIGFDPVYLAPSK